MHLYKPRIIMYLGQLINVLSKINNGSRARGSQRQEEVRIIGFCTFFNWRLIVEKFLCAQSWMIKQWCWYGSACVWCEIVNWYLKEHMKQFHCISWNFVETGSLYIWNLVLQDRYSFKHGMFWKDGNWQEGRKYKKDGNKIWGKKNG